MWLIENSYHEPHEVLLSWEGVETQTIMQLPDSRVQYQESLL